MSRQRGDYNTALHLKSSLEKATEQQNDKPAKCGPGTPRASGASERSIMNQTVHRSVADGAAVHPGWQLGEDWDCSCPAPGTGLILRLGCAFRPVDREVTSL